MKPRTKPRTLFILKYRHQSGGSKTLLKHSGLFNSAMFVHEMLLANGYDSRLVQVIDNNEIDRQVTLNKPDVVIIEALWVVPEKFEVLRKLHPNVKWIIRLHSELPFLSNEGIAMDWINRYVVQPNVFVSANSERAQRDLSKYLAAHANTELKDKLVYLPNYYPTSKNAVGSKLFVNGDTINVGCFGAIRPMKNHLLQAAAAVQYAEKHGLRCNFHITAEIFCS